MSAVRRVRSLVVIGALGVALPACGGGGPGPSQPSPAGEAASSHAAATAGPGGTASARAAALLVQPGAGRPRFPAPTVVDNPMFPLRPGTRFSYRGTVVEGGSATPHTVVFTVTDLTKVVGGIRTVVALDQDFLRRRLEEQELAFFAQDDKGNVWNFGEYPEEYDHGRLTGAPDTWLTGTGGAHGGIHMLGRPAAGVRYAEGRVHAIEFYDVSQVVSAHRVTCLGSRCLRRVLMVDEWSPGDPVGGHQIKYYAPGIGLVRVGARGGDSREYLRLAAVRHLSQPALARARAAALTMDRRAYRVSKIYRVTRPAAAPAS
ncbi:MAG TPA: hypothetical protein VGF32_29435 [Streptosporangiaceae bacterium]